MNVLEAFNLQKIYRRQGKQIEAVRSISLTIAPSEILAFLGPNGAGKTTTIKMIAGLVRPDRGRVTIVGHEPHTQPQALRSVGAVLEGSRNLYWQLTPEENIEYFGVLRGLNRKTAHRRGLGLLEQFGLWEKRHIPVQALSRGMQQKVAIAVALVHQPQLLLLDEPTLGLDVEASQHIKELIRDMARAGCAILLTTHQLDVAQAISDRVAIIQNGAIIALELTQEIIQKFSSSTYVIKMAEELDPLRRNQLEALGGIVKPEKILFSGTPEALYQAINILKPLPIVAIKKDDADLTHVFLKLIREKHNATPISC